jgi:hypothetical protein
MRLGIPILFFTLLVIPLLGQERQCCSLDIHGF